MQLRLWILLALLSLAVVLFMTLGARGSWSFLLAFRGTKVLALILVGASTATATLLFQTITQNRILTPSIMGFDALYLLLLTGFIFTFGSRGFLDVSPIAQFLTASGAMVVTALMLFATLLHRAGGDLMRMVLTGVVIATLFRSLAGFMGRLMDPNEFAVLQVASYARFNRIETDLLAISAIVAGLAVLQAWRIRHRLDVLALGRTAATNLGEDLDRGRLEVLALVAILVATSTALVGPVTFLGLLVVNVAYVVLPTYSHAILLPGAALISAITLVGGQTLLERALGLVTPLSVIVDLLGGAVFLWLILKGIKR